MQVNNHIGEIGVSWGDEDFLFRPTLGNIRKIGNPTEIIEALHILHGELGNPVTYEQRTIAKLETKRAHEEAVNVIQCCCEQPIAGLVGWYSGLKFHPGPMTIKNTITIARELLKAGTIGRPKPRLGQKKESVAEFDANEFISIAAKHFGVTRGEAMDMTMVEFQLAFDVAFPEQVKSSQITEEDERNADDMFNKWGIK